MIKRMILMLVLCALVLGGAFGYKIFGGMMMMKAMAGMGDAPQTVATVKARLEDWQSELGAVGTLVAAKGVDISPEVPGVVKETPFESGMDIEEGAVLLRMNDADEKAALDVLTANLKLAELTLARDEKQLEARAIAQATYDADKAALDSLKAQLVRQQAVLDKKTLRAPFSGKLGLRRVDIGQFVSAGTPVVALQQLDPLYLDFSLPQQQLAAVSIGQKVSVRTNASPDKIFQGEITAIDAKVDEKTRNIDVRATIPNPEKALLPGMFASLSVTLGAPRRVLTLPQTAIAFNPYGNTVFIVEPAKGSLPARVKSAFVKTGPARGDQIAVLDGVKEGDEIVSAGQMKLRNGTAVTIDNSVQPTNEQAPEPKDK